MSEIVEKEEKDISLLMDVKVRMTVRLGTCKMPMSQVMELVLGSVIHRSGGKRPCWTLYQRQARRLWRSSRC